MPIIAMFLFLVFSLPIVAVAGEPQCFGYEPETVNLTGTVLFRTFSDANGNPERSPLLLLDQPICVEGQPNDTINQSEYDVIVVHLVLEAKEFGRLRALTGRSVVASGTLYHKHTAHHHADVLLTVKNLAESRK
jgi:hypothetical protein